MGRNFNPPEKKPKDGPCFDPVCMDKVAGKINGCVKAIHSGSLQNVDTSQFPIGGLIFNSDGMGMMDVWNGYCPEPLPYDEGFVDMIVTLPDGSKVKASSRDEDSHKLSWEPLDDTNCDAVLECILNAPPEFLAALCALLPVTATEVAPAAKAKK